MRPRGRLATLLLSSLICLGTGCSPSHKTDPAQLAAERFCRAYFEAANPAAALPLAGAQARSALQEEIRLLQGRRPPEEPVASTHIEAREEYEKGALIKFRVQVSVPPDPLAARGTATSRFSFDLFLRRPPGGFHLDWQIVRFTRL